MFSYVMLGVGKHHAAIWRQSMKKLLPGLAETRPN